MTQTALVTGASRGLGAALALALAKTHHVIAVARTVGALEALDDRIQSAGGTATLAPMDICQHEAMAHLCRSIFDRWGHLDLWLHTAVHAPPLSPAAHLDTSDFTKSLDTNTRALSHLIPMIAPLLQAAPKAGAVFFEDPHDGEKFFGAYHGTKSAGIALARAWQAETLRTGPKIHILTPKPMATATRARFFPGENRDPLATPDQEAERLLALI